MLERDDIYNTTKKEKKKGKRRGGKVQLSNPVAEVPHLRFLSAAFPPSHR